MNVFGLAFIMKQFSQLTPLRWEKTPCFMINEIISLEIRDTFLFGVETSCSLFRVCIVFLQTLTMLRDTDLFATGRKAKAGIRWPSPNDT